MIDGISMNKVGRLDMELARSNGSIVGNFSLGLQDADGSRMRMGIASAGLLLTMPAALGLGAGFLKQFLGITSLYDAMMNWNRVLMVGSLFVGAPLALAAGIISVTRVGFVRAHDKLHAFMAVRANPLILLSIALALLVVGLFWGHLAADAWACTRGITSAC